MYSRSSAAYSLRNELPSGLNPRQIGTDFLLGVWKNALDVEHVRLYSLTRG
jgi:hypothetical protein